jgi:hypothetical protein
MTDWNQIEREAERLIGTPTDVLQARNMEARATRNRCHAELRPIESEWHARRRAAPDGCARRTDEHNTLALCEMQAKLVEDSTEHRMQLDYAIRNGWRATEASFSHSVLMRSGVTSGTYFTSHGLDHFDHPDWFRASRRAAAIVGHTYPVARDESIELARYTGLGLAMPTDYPSWYYPGATTLKVWMGQLGRSTFQGEVLVEPDPDIWIKREKAHCLEMKEKYPDTKLYDLNDAQLKRYANSAMRACDL